MNRVAALYDIHGNLPALEAVLEGLTAEHVDAVVIGGDFLWGPMPKETLDRLRTLEWPTVFVHGNTERSIYTRKEESGYAEANNWCADRLSPDELRFLQEFPLTETIDIDGLGAVLFCHASPRNDEESITARTSEDRIREMCEGQAEHVIVCGHTHAQFDRKVAERRIVNPGSVGLPFGDRGAYWAILGPGVDLRFTTYDVDATAQQVRRSGFPASDMFIESMTKPHPASVAADLFTT